MSDRVTVSISDGVADVRLNRPDKLNALDPEMFQAIADAGARLVNEPGLRAVVLSGEGRSFCAGLDVVASATNPGDLMDTGDRITHLGQQVAHCWSEVPVPVIAAVWGHCLGGGLQIAAGADIRIVHPEAKLSVLEIRLGIAPDMTGTATLPRLVGVDVAKELTWTGRMISGEEADQIGLATSVSDDPLADARALAEEIATKNPHAIRGSKRLFDQSGRVSLADQYATEREVVRSLIGSPNQIEAVSAHFEKRTPTFTDL